MTRSVRFRFRLYVARDAQNSVQALANISALCEAHLRDRYELEVVDVFKDSNRALEDRVFLTPTLIKLSPLPVRRIVGTLSHTATVLQVLGLGVTRA